MNFIILFVCLIVTISLSEGTRPECKDQDISEEDVLKFVFSNWTFSKLRPRLNISDTVDVYLQLKLYGIRDFREREGVLETDAYLSVGWEIPHIAWKHQFPYNCIDRLLLASDNMWTPDYIWISGGFDVRGDNRKVIVYNTGDMYQFPMGELRTSCNSDLTYFPFDHQNCDFVLESWHYPVEMQHFIVEGLDSFDIVTHFWHENKLWEIIGNSSHVVAVKYSTDGPYYDQVIYTLKLQRKPLYYVFNIVIPSLIISIVEMAVFVLPMDEQAAKVETSFTCLVAYSVFQSMILSEIPISSHETPLLSIFIVLQMCYIGFIAILGEALVVYLVGRHNDGKLNRLSVPPRIVLQLAWLIRPLLWISEPEMKVFQNPPNDDAAMVEECTSEKTISVDVMDNDETLESTDGDKRNSKLKTKSKVKISDVDLIKDPWMFVAIVFERFNVIFYLLAVTLTPLFMFACIPVVQYEKVI